MTALLDRLYHTGYIPGVIEVHRTDEFDGWLARLKDRQARARILARIARLSFGNPGDAKSVGGGVSELRIAHGPGHRLYSTRRGERIVDAAGRRRQVHPGP